jgi:DNA (cytosine-5)-methyltransferase 1
MKIARSHSSLIEVPPWLVGGLFSGVGGIEMGFERAGFKVAWSNDVDPAASATFAKNFHHEHILKDVRKLTAKDVTPVDVLVGGFPCQAFSVAGYRKGFGDDRGNLFFEITRLIEEQEEEYGWKPKALFLENVKNFYTHDKGNTFKVVLEKLGELGYFVFHGVLNTSKITGIPQNRERIFMICFHEGDGDFKMTVSGGGSGEEKEQSGQLLFEVETKPMATEFFNSLPISKQDSPRKIKDFLEKKRVGEKYYYRADKYMYQELIENVKTSNTVYQWRRRYVRENKSNVCPTLTANMGTGGHNVPLVLDKHGIRKLTPRECFNLQGFPSDYQFPSSISDSQLYKQAGNSVTVAVIEKLARLMRGALDKGR